MRELEGAERPGVHYDGTGNFSLQLEAGRIPLQPGAFFLGAQGELRPLTDPLPLDVDDVPAIQRLIDQAVLPPKADAGR